MRTRKDTAAGVEPGDGRLDAAAQEAIERFARVMSRCGIAPKILAHAFMSAVAAPAEAPPVGFRDCESFRKPRTSLRCGVRAPITSMNEARRDACRRVAADALLRPWHAG